VCTLDFVEDFAYQEIADTLRVPVGTVPILQKRLRRRAADRGLSPRGPRATEGMT